jgi:UDP-glucose 4-epimerase
MSGAMRVVVTGGAGYIGSVVTEAVVEHGHTALVIDNLSKGHRDAVIDGAAFAQIDLGNHTAVRAALESFGADAVIHLAADSIVGESMTNPSKYYRNNLVAGLGLLDAMKETGVRALVFSSTAAVYGEPERQPIDEAAPTAPTNPYGESKLSFERALRWYHQAYDIGSVSLRYFNAAGATRRNGERHSPETHLIPLALQAAVAGSPPLTIFGADYPTRDGTCVRDYIHVHDLAHAHLLALESLSAGPTCRAYNLGCGGDGYTVREVIAAVRSVTGRDVPVSVAARRAGDPPMLVASSDRIGRELGWTPELPGLERIVASAWDWMRQQERVPEHARS